MPLEVNAQFNQFVQFAEQQMQAGKATAKAQVGDAAQDNPLAGRTIVAKSGDFVGNIDRLAAVDYSKYDGARMTQHVLDPNAERPYETVRQVLDPDFRFASDNDAVTCRTGYKITVA